MESNNREEKRREEREKKLIKSERLPLTNNTQSPKPQAIIPPLSPIIRYHPKLCSSSKTPAPSSKVGMKTLPLVKVQ